MSQIGIVAAAALAGAIVSAAAAQDAVQWRVEDGGNGHWYQLVLETRVRTDAAAACASRGGHLIDLYSEGEANFARTLGADTAWIGIIQNLKHPDYQEPDSGWFWDSGTAPTYTRWRAESNEPNDLFGIEHTACMAFDSIEWNDVTGQSQDIPAFFIEWSADCNDDGIVDYGQILDGTLVDDDGDGVPDLCGHDLNGDGIPDFEQLMVAIPRAIGSGVLLSQIDLDRDGNIYSGNGSNSGGPIFALFGAGEPEPYGPSLADPDTVCVNEGPIVSDYPESTILVGRESSITAIFEDGTTSEFLAGGTNLSNVAHLKQNADGTLGWSTLNPNPNLGIRWSPKAGALSVIHLTNDFNSLIGDVLGRTWYSVDSDIYRTTSGHDPNALPITSATTLIDLNVGMSPALAGGILVLDASSLRWIDATTDESLAILEWTTLPGLTWPVGLGRGGLAAHETNDHLAMIFLEGNGGNPTAAQYAIYDVFLSAADCNEDGEIDWRSIARDRKLDQNANGILDECEVAPCSADLNGDGMVGPPDLGILLALWNTDGTPNGADLNDDGIVTAADLGLLVGAWGACN